MVDPAVEQAIGIPVSMWPGNCFAIATKMVDAGVVDGKPEYGIWTGPIDEGSPFKGRLIARHGWVRMPDDQICDPTRWVFENVEPYIYVGPEDHYDMGAADLREGVLGYVYADEAQILDFLDDPEAFIDEIEAIRMLANTPPKVAPYLMGEVYEAIDRMGHGAWIPIDYQEWAGI